MEIYIHKNGQQYGPFSLDEINSKVRSSGFSSSDPAWIEGWSDWQTLAAIPGFITKPSPPPFKPPQAAQISASFSDNELRGINQARKGVIWAFLAWIAFLLTVAVALQIDAGIFKWVPACFSAVCVYRLAVALKLKVVWIYPILILHPLVGFIVMMVITMKATKALRAGGLEVGLMGVSSAALNALGKNEHPATILPTNPPVESEAASEYEAFTDKEKDLQPASIKTLPQTGDDPSNQQQNSDQQQENQENTQSKRRLFAFVCILAFSIIGLTATVISGFQQFSSPSTPQQAQVPSSSYTVPAASDETSAKSNDQYIDHAASDQTVSEDRDYQTAKYKELSRDYAGMLACAKTLVSRYPNSPLALKCLGNSHYYNNSNEKALSVILHVIQIQPDDLIASHDLGSIYHAMKKLPEAEAAYRKGLTINPLDPLLLADLGSIQIERGQAGEGLSSAQRAEAVLNKKTFDNHYGEIWEEWIWRKLGWVYYNTSHFQDAIVAYEKSTALVPNDAVSWSMLGWSFVRIDRCFEAINPFKMSIEFDPLNSGSAWHGLGQAFLNLRQNADAADALEHATTLDAKNAVAWQELGSAYRALGRNADAVIAFEKATTLDPNISVAVAPATSSDASVSDSNTTKAPTDAERFVAQGEQLLATLRFPSLGTADSPLNTEFVRRYRMYKQSNPSYFKNPKWPTLLAEESAAALNSPK